MITIDIIVAIIAAAGQGKRMGSELNKQYLSLLGKPILAYTIQAFWELAAIDKVLVVVREDELDYCQQEVIDKYNLNEKVSLVVGGATRQKSVYNALQATKRADYVVVHDGARPLISSELIESALEEVKKEQAVVVAVPVKDTIKIADHKNFVVETPERDSLWAVQTPQLFDYDLVLKAYQEAIEQGFVGTDSAMLVEKSGEKVKLIKGSYENLKLTTPEDLMIAETIINRRLECE